MVSAVRAVAFGGLGGTVLALCLVAPTQFGVIAQEPVQAALATVDALFPPDRLDTGAFRKYEFTLDDGVSTEVQRTRVVTKIGHGLKSQVTIVTTPSGTYSTDGLLSPNVRYPGIEKRLKRLPEDFDFAQGGKWMSYADGSFVYLVFRVPATNT